MTKRSYAKTTNLAASVCLVIPGSFLTNSFVAAPAGQTCYQWAGEFANYVGGYLNNPNGTGECEFCQYRVGDSFYANLEISYSTRWRDFGIFVIPPFLNVTLHD